MKILRHIQNLLLFFRALISIIRYGTRKNMPVEEPRKVLVVQLAKLGDMVCITPVLRALRKNLPNTKIYVLGNAINKQVLEGNSDFDEYIIFDKGKISGVVEYLKKEHIDVACLRGIGFIGLVTVLCAGIKTVITSQVAGRSGFETRTYRWLLPFVCTVEMRLGEYMPRQFLYLLEPLGINADDTTKHLGFTREADQKVKQFFTKFHIDPMQDFVVGVSPSAGNKIKEWPEERFAEVVDHLTQKYDAKVLLIGGPTDKEKVQNVFKNIKKIDCVYDAQGIFNIDELKALISYLKLFISVDTGPIYIAEAFGVATIDIVGPVDEREQPPQGPIHCNIVPPNRVHSELSILNARGYDTVEARNQVESITTELVINAFDRLYPSLKK